MKGDEQWIREEMESLFMEMECTTFPGFRPVVSNEPCSLSPFRMIDISEIKI